MSRVLVFVLLLGIILVADAQLTFSTGWGNGKRSVNTEGENDVCIPDETIYVLYKLIQSEAEKFLACKNGAKN